MLRDLSTVLEDLHGGVQAYAGKAANGVRITKAEMTLPVNAVLVLKDGGCALLADVTRNYADALWNETPSRLTLVWAETPTETLIPEGDKA
jgi:hypothetical protein